MGLHLKSRENKTVYVQSIGDSSCEHYSNVIIAVGLTNVQHLNLGYLDHAEGLSLSLPLSSSKLMRNYIIHHIGLFLHQLPSE